MTVSAHTYSATILTGTHRLSPTSGSLALDETWVPYAQGELTMMLPDDPAVVDALDPRAGARVILTMRQRFTSSAPVSALSADLAGLTVGDVSALWDGLTVGDVSARYGTPFNAGVAHRSTRRTANLGVRVARVDRAAGTLTLDLASDEALLMDHRLMRTAAVAPVTPTVRDAVELVLAAIGGVLLPGDDDAPITEEAQWWEPGVSAWDYVEPLVNAAGLRLWCDERRQWHLTQPLTPSAGAVHLTGATSTQIVDTLTRNDWYDGVVVEYRWRDSSGMQQVRYDIAGSVRASRVLHVVYDRPWPRDGAAAAIWARRGARGRVQDVTAVSSYSATPGQVLTVTAGGDVRAGMVTRVRWDLGADEMTLTSRDLADADVTSWAMAPGTWADVPAGLSWADYHPNLIPTPEV